MIGILATLALVLPCRAALVFRRIEPLSWIEQPVVATVAGDRLLVGTRHGGLFQLKAGARKLTAIQGPSKRTFTLTIAKAKGRAIIGTGYGDRGNGDTQPRTWILDNRSDEPSAVQGLPADAEVLGAAPLGKGVLLGTVAHGLWFLGDGSVTASRIEGPPAGDRVYSISVQSDRAFITTDFHGLWVVEAGRDIADSVVKNTGDRARFYALSCQHFDGQTLVGTDSGLWTIKDGTFRMQPIAGIPKDSVVRRITSDGRRAYIGTWHGFFYLDPGAAKATRLDSPATDLSVMELEWCDGALLISTDEGLWALQNRSRLIKLTTIDGLVVRNLFVSSNRAIFGGWVQRGNRIDRYWWEVSDGDVTPIAGDVHLSTTSEHVTPLYFDGHFFVADQVGVWEVEHQQ